MTKLNIPPYPARIRKNEDGRQQIFDDLRRRWVSLTPEEWVRQNFTHHLTNNLGYPSALMGNEIVVRLNGMSKRCDTLVCRRDGSPLMIIEYKAPEIEITENVFRQISRYNSVMHVDYLIVSNGLQHYCVQMNYKMQTYAFLREIPRFETL